MILDTLNNAHNYVNLHPQFGMVFDYLLHTDFAALTDGKRQLDGTDVYIDLATIQGRQPPPTIHRHSVAAIGHRIHRLETAGNVSVSDGTIRRHTRHHLFRRRLRHHHTRCMRTIRHFFPERCTCTGNGYRRITKNSR